VLIRGQRFRCLHVNLTNFFFIKINLVIFIICKSLAAESDKTERAAAAGTTTTARGGTSEACGGWMPVASSGGRCDSVEWKARGRHESDQVTDTRKQTQFMYAHLSF
jgi:hypothetical protein